MLRLEKLCGAGVHCLTCRDKEGGREWRESLRQAFTLPGDLTDFVCPHGRPWGFQAKAAPIETVYTKVLAICNGCEHKTRCNYGRRGCLLQRTLDPDALRQHGAMCPRRTWAVYAAEPDKLVIPGPCS